MSDAQIQAAREREERRRRIREEAKQRTEALTPSQRQRLEREFNAAGSEARMISRAGRVGF